MNRSTYSWLLALLVLFAPTLARAQATGSAPFGLGIGQAPALQVSAQFQFTHANAPPGQCGCFWMDGAGFQANLSILPAWSVMTDIYYAHNGAVDGSDEQLSVFNFLFGPRYSYRTTTRFTPYAQALVGESHVTSNYSEYTSNNTFLAAEGGAGIEMILTPRIAAVPVEADWVFSRAANGVNSRQNNLRIGVGVVYRFGAE